MSGWLTDGLNQLAILTGNERTPLDTNLSGGQQPLCGAASLIQLAAAMNMLANSKDKTTVSGTRYYSSFTVGAPANTAQDGGSNATAPLATVTGVNVLVGGTGGTDLWIAELHDSAGALVATSALAGVTAGTASTWQQIPFTATVALLAGTYFIAIQSNGTTAKPATYNSPALTSVLTGSATGVFGTSASITAPTTYTANLGPVCLLY